MNNNIINDNENINFRKNDNFYKGVMTWLAVAIGVSASASYFIGPHIPVQWILPLAIVLIAALIISSFSKMTPKLSPLLIFVIPSVLGVIFYPILDSFFASGSGVIIVQALVGTAIVFGTAAVLGWKSDKNMSGWHGPLFAIVLGLIALSLMNVFLFKLGIINLLISCAILVVFTIYSFIDVQAVKKKAYGDQPPQYYALQIFLDIYNIFVSLLNIIRSFS